LALGTRLPTGDAGWEGRQFPGNLPLILAPTRYRGRAFGFNAILGVSRDLGAWTATASAGYLHTGPQSFGAAGREADLGDCALAGLALARGGDLRFRASRSFPQGSRVEGEDAFRAPATTLLDARVGRGRQVRFSLEASLALYGLARRAGPEGGLTVEPSRSFGNRLDLTPGLEYGWGPRARFRTEGQYRTVARNGYGMDDPSYEGGGTVLGARQEFRWAWRPGLGTRWHAGYGRLVHRDAAVDAGANPVPVGYDDWSLGTGVDVQW
jgi:hypothetical protein